MVESTKLCYQNKQSRLTGTSSITVNSFDAEFPPDFKDNKLIFSSLKADSLNQQEEVYSKSYRNKIFSEDSLGEFKAFEINKDL